MNEPMTAHKMLFALIANAIECTTKSREFRAQLKEGDSHANALLASEAMNASMNAIEALARAMELACNMLALGITANVSQETPPAETATPFKPTIVGSEEAVV